MKLKVQFWSWYGQDPGYYVWKKDWLWGWEIYDHIAFPTYSEAMHHAAMINQINS